MLPCWLWLLSQPNTWWQVSCSVITQRRLPPTPCTGKQLTVHPVCQIKNYKMRRKTVRKESASCEQTLLCPRGNVLILLWRHTWVFVYSRSRWQAGFSLLFFLLLLFCFFSCAALVPTPLSGSLEVLEVWAAKSLYHKLPRWLNQIEEEAAVQPLLQSSTTPQAVLPNASIMNWSTSVFSFFNWSATKSSGVLTASLFSSCIGPAAPRSPHTPLVCYRHTFLHCLFAFLLPPPPSPPPPHPPSFLLLPFLKTATSVLPSIYIL